MHTSRFSPCCVLFCCIYFICSAISAAEDIPYSVAAWKEPLGNHRARIKVADKADAVRVSIPWRRRDRRPETKHITVVEAAGGKTIDNVARIRIDRESAELAFQPPAPGEYYVYFAPFTVPRGGGTYKGDYLEPKETAAAKWLDRHGLAHDRLAEGKWKNLPRAEVVEFQARTPFDRVDPMEVVATRDEMKKLLADHPQPYLIFTEDRSRPIRMRDELPLRWIRSGPVHELRGRADRNEYYAFQIGVFAAGQPIERLDLEFGDLRSPQGGVIPAAKLDCINFGGIDHLGRPFKKSVSVPQGKVQALWCGIDVPRDAKPGEYQGVATVRAEGAEPTPVRIVLTVTDQVREDRGDDQPERYSRIRWLNSTLGINNDPIAPYTPLKIIDENKIRCLGREVELASTGLPAQISCGGRTLLHRPMSFVVQTDKGSHPPVGGKLELLKQAKRSPGTVTWQSQWTVGPLEVQCRGEMEFDGHQKYTLTCRAPRAVELRDARLEMYFPRSAVPYFMGLGRKGGRLPKEKLLRWKWGGKPYYDSFWIGDVTAGLHCELRGANYCGPMVNIYLNANQLKLPKSWDNGGLGGCEMIQSDGKLVGLRAYSGARKLEAGETITFEFALMPTPVKPLDTAAHFRERYFHNYKVEKAAEIGANVVNVHHATPPNPFINYPFLTTEQLRAYTQEAHRRGMKLKIYYTVRELTNHAAELWALRSLGHEILLPGGGGGYPWLREHLVDDYWVAWYDHMNWGNNHVWPDGSHGVGVSAAFITQGNSRWLNYYVEGLRWLVENTEIDGLYLDDVSYDRETLKRMRRAMARRPGCMIDLHSNTRFAIQSANQYMEFFPYVDRLWFGEGFDYDESPDHWLIEISGIPYGLMGDMLQNGGNRWRGMIYGMTARVPWRYDAVNIWPLWDSFGIAESRMIGYWDPACPVRTDNQDILATAYVREGKTLVALASWAKTPVECRLKIDWKALKLDPAKVELTAPEIKEFQPGRRFTPSDAIPVEPGRGWVLIAEER